MIFLPLAELPAQSKLTMTKIGKSKGEGLVLGDGWRKRRGKASESEKSMYSRAFNLHELSLYKLLSLGSSLQSW